MYTQSRCASTDDTKGRGFGDLQDSRLTTCCALVLSRVVVSSVLRQDTSKSRLCFRRPQASQKERTSRSFLVCSKEKTVPPPPPMSACGAIFMNAETSVQKKSRERYRNSPKSRKAGGTYQRIPDLEKENGIEVTRLRRGIAHSDGFTLPRFKDG